MFGAEPITVPHRGIQYAQPSSWKEPGGIFRLAASACVVAPIAAQTTAVIAIIRAILMLSPRGWSPLPAGSQINRQDRCCATRPLHLIRLQLPVGFAICTLSRAYGRMSSNADI